MALQRERTTGLAVIIILVVYFAFIQRRETEPGLAVH